MCVCVCVWFVRTIELQYSTTNTNTKSEKQKDVVGKWVREEDENLWQSSRAEIMENYLNFTGSFPTECDKCSMACVIRCTDCQAHLCYQCDESVHSIQVLHNRSTTTENKWKVLLPSEFIDAAHRLVVKGLSSSDKQSFIISNNEVFYIRCFIAYI